MLIRRELAFFAERLESRLNLAGNVTLSISANDELIITGDTADNQLNIFADDNEFVFLRGENGTTINGEGSLQLIGGQGRVDRDLIVRLGNGNDAFGVDDVHLVGDTTVETQAGDDVVVFRDVQRDGHLNLDLGSGDNVVFLLDLYHGLGADPGTSNTGLRISTLSGDDQIFVDFVEAYGIIEIDTGGGDDYVTVRSLFNAYGSVASFQFGSGNDSVRIDYLYAGSLRIDLGAGHDDLDLTDASTSYDIPGVRANFVITGGSGDDEIAIDGPQSYGDSTVIDTGPGNDELEITSGGFATDLTRISLGSGDNNLRIDGIEFYAAPDEIGGAEIGEILIESGGGEDSISITNSYMVEVALSIVSGGGTDHVTLSEIETDNAKEHSELAISTGSGGDTISLKYLDAFRTIRTDTAGGDDVVKITGSYIDESTTIDTGGGDDNVELQESGMSTVQVSLSSGDDSFQATRAYMGSTYRQSAVSIDGAGGHDVLLFEYGFLYGAVNIDTGNGRDAVYLKETEVAKNYSSPMEEFTLSTAGGNDLVSLLDTTLINVHLVLDTGSGSDLLNVARFDQFDTEGNIEIDILLGSGNDGLNFLLDDVSYEHIDLLDVFVDAGGRSDLLVLTGPLMRLSLAGGSGNDKAVLNRLEATAVQANLGSGNDQLYVSRLSQLPASAALNGGEGQDHFQQDSALLVNLQPQSFETILPPASIDGVVIGSVVDFTSAWIEQGGDVAYLS